MGANELVAGRYRLEERLARGGMADVWRATDERLRRPVAIKFLASRLTSDPEFLVRFFNEAQSVARISHANVVPVLDFGEDDGKTYLVMEFVAGGSLDDRTGEPVDPAEALSLITQTARGAGAAHEIGLVHRDIKPANILLTPDRIPKLADFGIALVAGQEKLTATGTAVGSPHYISPEQATGAPTGPASDVYSLGVVLYELLTGRRPFEAPNVTALAIAHVEGEAEPPSAIVEGIDPHVEALVMTCLAKDPSHRFPDGAALARACEDPAGAAATAAWPVDQTRDEGPAETDAGGNGRRRLVGAAVVLVLLAALGLGAWTLGRRAPDVAVADPKAGATERDRTPSPTLSFGGDAAPASSPTPTPSETKATKDREREEPPSSGAGAATEPTEAPETPASTPTSDPSPAPVEEETPGPEPTSGQGAEEPGSEAGSDPTPTP